ncbi:hypothetical protein Trydic_g12862, partial [Trypoxylus dichotomus]
MSRKFLIALFLILGLAAFAEIDAKKKCAPDEFLSGVTCLKINGTSTGGEAPFVVKLRTCQKG